MTTLTPISARTSPDQIPLWQRATWEDFVECCENANAENFRVFLNQGYLFVDRGWEGIDRGDIVNY